MNPDHEKHGRESLKKKKGMTNSIHKKSTEYKAKILHDKKETKQTKSHYKQTREQPKSTAKNATLS